MSNDVPKETMDRWRKLVLRLSHGTKTEQIDWDSGAKPESIITSIGDIVVTVEKTSNMIWVTISDEFGSTIDSFSDEDVHFLPGAESAWTVLNDAFNTARRKINGADKYLDAILSALPKSPLEEDDEIPF